jgi:hypothetical protein
MKQIHTISGERYVDRCNNFGGKGGYGIWSAFMSLVVWIAWNILHIMYFVYVDDNFGFERAEAHMFHACLACRLSYAVMRKTCFHWVSDPTSYEAIPSLFKVGDLFFFLNNRDCKGLV